MEGIDILNKTEICTTPLKFSVLLIVSISCCIVLLTAFLMSLNEGYVLIPIICSILFILFALLTVYASKYIDSVKTGRYQYEVTVDDSVSFTELYEKYDIVEQRGEIWVIEDKKE